MEPNSHVSPRVLCPQVAVHGNSPAGSNASVLRGVAMAVVANAAANVRTTVVLANIVLGDGFDIYTFPGSSNVRLFTSSRKNCRRGWGIT